MFYSEEPMEKSEKLKALQAAITQIEKENGKGSIMKLGDESKMKIECIPTGCMSLDLALGVGGIPRGRIIEIYGPESSGKTTLALHMVAEAQKLGGIAGYIDAEHALDPAYARNIGVDIDNLYISQPDSGEQALNICETMVRSGAVDIIIVDSVAALVPQHDHAAVEQRRFRKNVRPARRRGPVDPAVSLPPQQFQRMFQRTVTPHPERKLCTRRRTDRLVRISVRGALGQPDLG